MQLIISDAIQSGRFRIRIPKNPEVTIQHFNQIKWLIQMIQLKIHRNWNLTPKIEIPNKINILDWIATTLDTLKSTG